MQIKSHDIITLTTKPPLLAASSKIMNIKTLNKIIEEGSKIWREIDTMRRAAGLGTREVKERTTIPCMPENYFQQSKAANQ